MLKQGFIGLFLQNAELFNDNQELKEKLDQNTKETQEILKILDELLKQQALIQERKNKRKNRKPLPQKDPLTEKLYDFLIQRAIRIHRETYQGARLRLALAILAVTGVRISELLPLKINQIDNLFANSWIAIDRVKRGPSSHKAFLTLKGRKIIRKRARDFEIILFSKENDSYVFTPQYSDNPLSRQAFNKIINNFESIEELPNKPNIKSHSFRIGFINDLCKYTGDIEFVRQAIGHAKIDTTSKYVQNLNQND